MSHQPTAAEQHQNLVAQERNLLAEKARLSEQLETINAQLNFVRTSLQGVQLGAHLVAEKTAEAVAASEAEKAPAPSEG